MSVTRSELNVERMRRKQLQQRVVAGQAAAAANLASLQEQVRGRGLFQASVDWQRLH
jgi:hypothetical protein